MDKKQIALSLLSVSGAFRLGEMISSTKLVALTYHRVVPRGCIGNGTRPSNTIFTDEFDAQMSLVAQRFNVLDAQGLRDYLEGRGRRPRYAVAVTFDDGYENNYLHALPILRRHGLHAVFFVTANLIGQTKQLFWFDRLDRLLVVVGKNGLLARLRHVGVQTPTDTGMRIQSWFKTLAYTEQANLLDELERHFADAGLPAVDPTVHGLMSWEQVRSMADAGMTIGSHSANHQILSSVSPDAVDMELVSSRRRIEKEIARECWCFAYPNGEREDFRESDEQAVKRAGYVCAFTQIPGAIGQHSARFALPRIPIPDTGDMLIFRSYVSGVQRTLRTVFPGR